MAELSLGLFSCQIVSVVHVLMLSKIRVQLSHLRIKLNVKVFLFPNNDGVLYHNININICLIKRDKTII
jgi:hypothetical protein